MADLSAATQSPSVSSTSSGAEPSAPGGAGSPGACPALGTKSCGSSCAEGPSSLCPAEPPSESRTSSSCAPAGVPNTDLPVPRGERGAQPGSRPVLAEEGEGEDCWALPDVKTTGEPQGTSKDGASSPVSAAEGGHCSHPAIPASFPERPASLSKKAVQAAEQESRTPKETPSRDDRTAVAAGDQGSLPTAQKRPAESSEADGTSTTHSSSPGRASGGGGIAKGSPESPFEVILDRAAFDREFQDAYRESAHGFGSWAPRTAGAPPADVSESRDRVCPLRPRGAAPALLSRQPWHTAAALEEVSRCVSDMHSFTTEMLAWDLVPRGAQQSDRSDRGTNTAGLDTSGYKSEIPVINLKADTHQSASVCSPGGGTPLGKPASDGAESPLPREHAAVRKPDSGTHVGGGGVHRPGDARPEPPVSPLEKCGPLAAGAAHGPLAGAASRRSALAGEGTGVDGAGASGDTVAGDIAAGPACAEPLGRLWGDSPPEDLAAFSETGEAGRGGGGEGGASEAAEAETADSRTAPPEGRRGGEPGGSETKAPGSESSEPDREASGGEPPGVRPARGPLAAALARGAPGARGRACTAAPEPSRPQRPPDAPEHTDGKTGSELGASEKPAVPEDTAGLNRTALAAARVPARPPPLTPPPAPAVHDLIFWRDVGKTGFVFGATLVVLLSLAAFSVISVVSYLVLALLSVTISFRVYRSVIQAVQKSEEGHPFKSYLDVDITLSSEAFHNYVNAALVHVNRALKLLVRLFLVEDLVDSLKLAVFMWLMTYVGAVFNGITLLILAELLVFSVPIVYEKYKTQIDHYVGLVREQTKSIVEKVQAKLPGMAKKKAE